MSEYLGIYMIYMNLMHAFKNNLINCTNLGWDLQLVIGILDYLINNDNMT